MGWPGKAQAATLQGDEGVSRRTKVVLGCVWLAAMVGLLWWVLGPPRLSDEEQIRAALDRVERGIELGQAGPVLGAVSHNYSDSQGMTRRDIRDGLLYAFRHDASFDIVVDVESLKVSGDSATVETHVRATVVWGRGAPESYEADVTLTFVREGRQWRCINAEGWHEMEGGIAAQDGL
jgi:hypothetical protein